MVKQNKDVSFFRSMIYEYARRAGSNAKRGRLRWGTGSLSVVVGRESRVQGHRCRFVGFLESECEALF